MTKLETKKIQEIFDYLYNPTLHLQNTDGVIVFGRADPLVAEKASKVYNDGLTNYLLFTGGIGKDSGILTEFKIPEAYFLSALANSGHRVPREVIYLEPNATNGDECCRFSLDKILEYNLPHDKLALLIHPTSLRRIDAAMKSKTQSKEEFKETNFQRIGTDYRFNSSNPVDREEAVAELLRLADWPAKGWCVAQDDLPLDLVDYAREIKDKV